MVTINQIQKAVEQVAPRYDIRGLRLFGSYATGKFHANSDIDLLVEYSENPVSLLKIRQEGCR
jgi:predicted nucleotidyltransferase